MTFRVGQKVVCIDSSGGCEAYGIFSGRIYTITNIGLWLGKTLHVDVKEIPSRVPLGWRATRFRPVVERKTDISFAHEILRKASDRVRA